MLETFCVEGYVISSIFRDTPKYSLDLVVHDMHDIKILIPGKLCCFDKSRN